MLFIKIKNYFVSLNNKIIECKIYEKTFFNDNDLCRCTASFAGTKKNQNK